MDSEGSEHNITGILCWQLSAGAKENQEISG